MPDPSPQTVPAQGMPIPFITAAWSGMSYDAIVAGLHAGSILPPPGAAPGWLPQPGTVGVASSPASALEQAAASQGAQVAGARGREEVAQWFTTLDAALSTSAFDAIWQRAGNTDAQRAEHLTGYLARALLGPGAVDDAGGDASTRDVGIALDAFVADPGHRAHVVDLTSMSGADLAAQAATDAGVRYALHHLDGIALTGNRALFAMSNADGALDRFDRDTGESLVSDAFLEDRGKLLAWKMAGDRGDELTVAGSEDWTFVDRATTDAQGGPLTFALRTGETNAGLNQVVFGTDDSDVMRGVRGSDRMYGGAGDDVLLGGSGADHLEGGAGADVVMGGAGNDELLGNQGDDDLDGGAADDTVQAGSGDDMVTGGRGNDRLEGGRGRDTYVLDAGDGSDTILDSDGLGAIELDGVAVGGSMIRDDAGRWMSADGRLEFTLGEVESGGGTLTLRAFAQGADHAGTPDNVVRIKDWKNGDLGITLAVGTDHVATGTDAATSSTSGNAGSEAVGQAVDGNSGDFAGEGAIATGNQLLSNSTALSAMVPGTAPRPATGTADGSDEAATPFAAPTLAESGAPSAQGEADTLDFDAILDSLLDSGTSGAKGLDPVALQRGVDAFSAVLAPPDVAATVTGAADVAAHGLTAMAIADALAGAVSADDDFHGDTHFASLSTFGSGSLVDTLAMPPSASTRPPDLAVHK